MRDRLLFYIKHAFRSLQRERRRSLFAAFAVAAGVAAIVGASESRPLHRGFPSPATSRPPIRPT